MTFFDIIEKIYNGVFDMKLIHLSDLHIGKRLLEHSLLEEQTFILEQILNVIDQEAPDAVLIAGDIYDKSVPSAEAVTLFDYFLNCLAKRNISTMIISGNHDSPERLAFGNRLIEGCGIHLSPVYDGEIKPISLSDEHGRVDFWLLPFVKPVHVRRFFPEEEIESYTDAVRVAVEQMPIDKNVRNILVTHQFVTGASTCESEELSVGGSDNVDASVFDAFDYVALGHIHGPQNILSPRIRYCGTPLKYSFSEAEHQKSVTVVELNNDLQIRTVPLTPKHDVRILRGNFADLIEAGTHTDPSTADYLHIILTDEEDVPEAAGRLRAVYPNVLKHTYDNTRTRETITIDAVADVQTKSPLELFEELYQMQNNQPMNETQRSYLSELIDSIQEGLK